MDEVRQIVIHPAAWSWVNAFFDRMGFDLAHLPVSDFTGGDPSDDIPTYIMVPRNIGGRA